MKKFINVDDFMFDIDEQTEDQLKDFLNTYFSYLSPKIGFDLSIDLKYTEKGYTYRLIRKRHHLLKGNWVIDQDCAIVTGLSTYDFQINPADKDHKPVAWGVIWCDGNYIPEDEIQRVYTMCITSPDSQPSNVRIYSTDEFVSVTVEYNDTANGGTTNNNDSNDEETAEESSNDEKEWKNKILSQP